MTITAQANIFASLCAVDCCIKRTVKVLARVRSRCADSSRRVAFSVSARASEGVRALRVKTRATPLLYTSGAWRHHRWTVPKECEECFLARFPSELSTTLSNFLLFFSLSHLNEFSPLTEHIFLLFPPSTFLFTLSLSLSLCFLFGFA